MSVEVNIKLYDIERCGYYQNRKKEPTLSSALDTFTQLFTWGSDVTIQDSSTFEPDEDSSILKQYLLDMKRADSGDFYITMWNQVPATADNAVAAVSATSTQAQPEFEFQDFRDGYIPGFATYYWISPVENRMATVRFERSFNGHKGFCQYMNGFLRSFTNHVVGLEDIEKNIVTVTGFGETEQNLISRFKTKSLVNTGPIEYIRTNIDRVSRIKSKSLIVPRVEEKESLYRRLLNAVACGSDKTVSEEFIIKYEMPVSLTLADFESMYAHWDSEEDNKEDVGFHIGKDDYWFGHEIQKTNINLNIHKDNREIYRLEDIMNQIEGNKEMILRDCRHEVD
jgi:hypothetical protein